ncbi:EF hand domain-containing protein [Ditylenchus destructor]|nr:EF hand domain-containing protein [Ditylenchus destructor]
MYIKSAPLFSYVAEYKKHFAAMKVFITVFILSVIFAVVTLVSGDSLEDTFSKADSNGDGKLSLEEVQSGFRKADTNHDGLLSFEEYRLFSQVNE